MSDYAALKKLDEESARKLQEGSGPTDECLCSILGTASKKSFTSSMKKAFKSLGKAAGRAAQKSMKKSGYKEAARYGEAKGGKFVELPLSFDKGGRGVFTTKEVVKRTSPCGKCGCDSERIVLKHSIANIRVTSPDISSICPCDSNCLEGKDKLMDNIQVTIE